MPFKRQCKIDYKLEKSFSFIRFFQGFFEQLFTRISLRGCYGTQNMKSMTKATPEFP